MYRLSHAGPAVLDRAAAALALVPATALLAGRALALPLGAENLSFALLWSAGGYGPHRWVCVR